MKKKVKKILMYILSVLVFFCCTYMIVSAYTQKLIKPEDKLISELERLDTLSTIEITYHTVDGFYDPDNKVVGWWIFKRELAKEFWVELDMSLKLGIDISDLNIEIKNNDIIMNVPKVIVTSRPTQIVGSEKVYEDKDSVDVVNEDVNYVVNMILDEYNEIENIDEVILDYAQQRAENIILQYIKGFNKLYNTSYEVVWRT